MNTTSGRHLLAEYRGCRTAILDDPEGIEQLMRRAALAAGATIITSAFHRFAPTGISGVVVIQESHLSIHTWPEEGYAATDFYTCGDCDPRLAHSVLSEGLGARSGELVLLQRGMARPAVTGRGSHGPDGEVRWDRDTLLPDPSQFWLVSGTGEGMTTLNAFDHALLAAGVGDTNLVRMSSIVPPGIARAVPRLLPPGALVPMAYAEMTSDTPGAVISAAVAVAIPRDSSLPGLIMEHHAEDSLASVESRVAEMALTGMAHRHRPVKDLIVRGATHTVERAGCAFAGVVLWGES